MRLDTDQYPSEFNISAYEPGKVTVQEKDHTTPFVLSSQGILPLALPAIFEDLKIDHLQPLIDKAPQVVIIGTGKTPQLPHADWIIAFQKKQIGIEIMHTAAACRTYNAVLSEERDVVAILFP